MQMSLSNNSLLSWSVVVVLIGLLYHSVNKQKNGNEQTSWLETLDHPQQQVELELAGTTTLCLKSGLRVWQVRIGVGKDTESTLVLHFTVECLQKRACDDTWFVDWHDPIERFRSKAKLIGSINNAAKQTTWNYFAAKTNRGEKVHRYSIGQVGCDGQTSSFSGEITNKNRGLIVVLGDTGDDRGKVFGALEKVNSIGLGIHVGDISYASNLGTCYGANDGDQSCSYDCGRQHTCKGRDDMQQILKGWEKFHDDSASFFQRVPIMFSMGNHDNDLPSFFKYRPSIVESFPNVDPSYWQGHLKLLLQEMTSDYSQQTHILPEVLSWPYFFSFDHGPIHFISLQSEDNGINAYERSSKTSLRYDGHMRNGVLQDEKLKRRFEMHFGKSSNQYRWLENDLKLVNKTKTPFVIVFTHRPIFHSSSHHPNCGVSGDWFGCDFRHTYAPIFQEFGVNLIISGHSHHYMRSNPIEFDPRTNTTRVGTARANHGRDFPRYIVQGTGGFRLDSHFLSNEEWVAFRDGRHLGFGFLKVLNEKTLYWGFNTTEMETIDETLIETD